MNDIPILYQDTDIIVVDKPAGVASHQSAGWNGDDVFSNLTRQGVQIRTEGDSYRQGIVSRLDVGTSGLMVLAKNQSAFESLKLQFQHHTVDKIYLALVKGYLKVNSGTIDAPIGRHPNPKKRALFAVVEDGKPARTHFDRLREVEATRENASSWGQVVNGVRQNDRATLLRIHLETGRTHQIRVHLSAYGHPLIGDINYGGPSTFGSFTLDRPFLHSAELSITHPSTGERLHFESELPEELSALLAE